MSKNNSEELLVSKATTQFGLNFIRNIPLDKNVVFSPLSIQNVLNMILLGAENESKTQDELNKVLCYGTLSENNRFRPHKEMCKITGDLAKIIKTNKEHGDFKLVNLILTNSSLVRLLDEFRANVREFYSVELEQFEREDSLGFVAKSNPVRPLHEHVNSWVEQNTNSQIKELASKDDFANPLLVAVLLNATYFKSNWLHMFSEASTRKQLFYSGNSCGAPKMVDFMHKKGNHFKYCELYQLDCCVLEIQFAPEKGDEFSFVVLLPNSKDGLAQLIKSLSLQKLDEIHKSLCFRNDLVVKLPKFNFESSFDLKELLNQLGLERIFEEKLAELSEMFGKDHSVHISKIVHKAKIVVDESGAEAAAATMATVTLRCSLSQPREIRFTADHPFLFMIRHVKSNLPLFMGTVNSL